MTRTDAQLARLGSLSQTEVRAEWQTVFEEPAPDLPLSLLQRALAHRIQEQAYGGLAPAVQRVLEMLSRDPDAKLTEPEIRLKPGSRLIRE